MLERDETECLQKARDFIFWVKIIDILNSSSPEFKPLGACMHPVELKTHFNTLIQTVLQ